MPSAPVPASPTAALLVDADGTLWDTRTAMETAGAAAAAAVWPSLEAHTAQAIGVRYRRDTGGYFRRFVAGELSFGQMREARIREVIEKFALPWRPDLAAAFDATYGRAFGPALRLYDDTLPLLRWCRDNAVPVRVLTNSSTAYTQEKIAATSLGEGIVDLCSRDCLGVGKPEPAIFEHACARLGLTPDQVLYVGDEWESDALGAARAGLSSLWLVRDDGDPAGEVRPTAERLAAARAHGIPIIARLTEVTAFLSVRAGEPDADLGAVGGDG